MDEHFKHDEETTSSILKNIEEHGVHIALVDTDGYSPRFGYSIGLHKGFNHPELIIIGLPPEVVGSIINDAKREIENGTRYIQGVNYDGFLQDYPIQFIEVEFAHYPDYLGYAGWYNDNAFNFPTLQVVWPDKKNNYPWQASFNEKFKFQQPLLDRNIDFKFLEERNLGVFITSEVYEGQSIKYVRHDESGDWEFYTGEEVDIGEPKLVCLEELVKRDSSLNEIYHLNFGEFAEREFVGAPWRITKSSIDE